MQRPNGARPQEDASSSITKKGEARGAPGENGQKIPAARSGPRLLRAYWNRASGTGTINGGPEKDPREKKGGSGNGGGRKGPPPGRSDKRLDTKKKQKPGGPHEKDRQKKKKKKGWRAGNGVGGRFRFP